MKNRLLAWEIGSYIFVGIVGAALHFTFELSNFSSNWVAFFSAVNESTWEHLKMVFWPGVFFALLEYTYVRDQVNNYLVSKTVNVFLMSFVITIGWYIYAPAVGRSVFPVDLALYYIAVFIGHFVGYRIMKMPPVKPQTFRAAAAGMIVMLIAFSTFTFFPPRIFLFEHFDLKDTGEYGILDDYTGLRYITNEIED